MRGRELALLKDSVFVTSFQRKPNNRISPITFNGRHFVAFLGDELSIAVVPYSTGARTAGVCEYPMFQTGNEAYFVYFETASGIIFRYVV
jgi:choline dehydrogenase-like flavoprotein